MILSDVLFKCMKCYKPQMLDGSLKIDLIL